MAESVKALLSVVTSHTAGSYSSKAHAGSSQMNNGVIHTTAAKGKIPQNPLLCVRIFRKKVKSQGLFSVTDKGFCFFYGVISQHRKHRTENFFLHNRGIRRNIIQYSRGNPQTRFLAKSPFQNCLAFDKFQHSVVMLFVYHFGIIGILQWIFSQHFMNPHFYIVQERLFHTFLHQKIIGSHTSLTAVQIFPEYQTPGRQFQIRRFVYDTGTFSTQFQGHRRQMDSCFFQYQLSHRFSACEENIVKTLL